MIGMVGCSRPRAVSRAKKMLVCGAFAAGKTTLCRALVEHLRETGLQVGLVTEVPRYCPYALNREQTPLASAWLVGEQIRREVEAAVGDIDLVICDRGVPDVLSHTIAIDDMETSASTLRDIVVDVGMAWCKTYDTVFWAKVDPSRPIEEDAYRVADKGYQLNLEGSLKEVFRLAGLEPLVLPRRLGDRIDVVLSMVRQ